MYLTDPERAAVSKALAALTTPVHLIFFEQSIGCDACVPTRRLLEELVGLNEGMTLEVLNLVLDKGRAEQHGIDRVPAIIVSTAERHGLRFLGAPAGNELMSLVAAIRMAGTADSGLSAQSRAQLSEWSKPLEIKVFYTPTCVYCPQMVTLANRIATEISSITATAIDATEYPDLVQRYGVNGVPKTFINDSVEVLGAVGEEELVRKILEIGR